MECYNKNIQIINTKYKCCDCDNINNSYVKYDKKLEEYCHKCVMNHGSIQTICKCHTSINIICESCMEKYINEIKLSHRVKKRIMPVQNEIKEIIQSCNECILYIMTIVLSILSMIGILFICGAINRERYIIIGLIGSIIFAMILCILFLMICTIIYFILDECKIIRTFTIVMIIIAFICLSYEIYYLMMKNKN